MVLQSRSVILNSTELLQLVELNFLWIPPVSFDRWTSGDRKHSTGWLDNHDHNTLMPRREPLSARTSSAWIPFVILPKKISWCSYIRVEIIRMSICGHLLVWTDKIQLLNGQKWYWIHAKRVGKCPSWESNSSLQLLNWSESCSSRIILMIASIILYELTL